MGKKSLALCSRDYVAHHLQWCRRWHRRLGFFLIRICCFGGLYSERSTGLGGRPSAPHQEAASLCRGPDIDWLGHRTRDRISFGKRTDSELASLGFCDRATHVPATDFPILAVFEACPCDRRFAVGFAVHSTRHRRPPGHRHSFFFLVIVLRLLFVS